MRSDRSHLTSVAPRVTALFASALALGTVAAACGGGSSGPGVADLGTTTSTQTASPGSPEGSKQALGLAYSRCMRSHGLSDFPDPGANGAINLSDQPGSDLNPNSAAFQAAARSCASTRGFKASQSAARNAQYTAELLRFARCVRGHGVPNFPDPSNLGPYQGIGFLINRRTLDPHSPALQVATNACQRALNVNPGYKSYG